MTTYSTGNPLGSTDPRDLYDNSENLDYLVNGEQESYDDRLGNARKSWSGMEADFQEFLSSSGYVGTGIGGAIQDYAAGIELTSYNQIIRDGDEFWRLSAGEDLPYTTDGSGIPEGGAFVSVGDAVLRQDLAADTGAGRVGTETGETVQKAINQRTIYVGSVAELAGIASPTDSLTVDVAGYRPGSDIGGGQLVWKSGRSKDDHNGITVFSNTVPWDGMAGSLTDYRAGVGETDPGGTGVFVRRYDGITDNAALDLAWAGAALDDPNVADTDAFNDVYQLALDTVQSVAWEGFLSLDSTVTIDGNKGVIFSGVRGHRQSGSALPPSSMIWLGGAAPMMDIRNTLNVFQDFSVENRGTATCWQEKNLGAMSTTYERLYFLNVSSHTPFSIATIHCLGSRLGYSRFRGLSVTKPSDIFILMEDGGTTGATPFTFEDWCLFRSSGDFTVFKCVNSSMEYVGFKDCTFIQLTGSLTVMDVTDPTLDNNCYTIGIRECEFDADPAEAQATNRFFKLTKCTNIAFDGNHVNMGGGGSVFDLVNSSVTSCNSNFARSIDYIFDADDDTRIRGVGKNDFIWAAVTGISNNLNCAFEFVTQAPTITLNGVGWGPAEPAHFVAEITTSDAYTFALDVTRPENWEPGQTFYLTVRNVSGGAIDPPAFASGSFRVQAGAFTAPANGKEITIPFRFYDTRAVQIGPEGPEVTRDA